MPITEAAQEHKYVSNKLQMKKRTRDNKTK
jgi:hypothetical protein